MDNSASEPSPETQPLPSDSAQEISAKEPLLGTKTGLVAAVLTGLLYFLAFPGIDLWPFAFVAWVPWMMALKGASPRRAALQGLLVGLTNHLLGFYWLLGMLKTFSGFPTFVCAIFMVLLCAYQGAIFAFLGWLYARGVARAWGAGLVFTCAFAASETLYPLLFPFTYGATMHEVYPIVQAAEIGGPILVALIVLAANWAFSELSVAFLLRRRAGKHFNLSGAFRDVRPQKWGALLAIPLLSFLYGMVRIVQVDKAVHDAEKVRIGIVQANAGLMEKVDQKGAVLKRHIQMTKDLVKKEQIDLAIWSETSVAGAIHEDRANQYYQKNVTGRLGVPAIVGAVLFRQVKDERQTVLFNSALISKRNGKIAGRYDKQFLLLFGEYLPFGETFPWLYNYSPNSGKFSPGTSYEPLDFEGHDIATFICYEDIVPSFVNKLMTHGEPELLVNMTNDAWFGDTSEPHEHMALAKLRAVEQRRYLIRSTNSGVSGVVDPVGRLVASTETFKEATLAENVAWLKLKTPYQFWGNGPWWLLSAFALGFAFIRRPR